MDDNYDIKLHTDKEIAILHFQQNFNEHYPFLKIVIAKNAAANQLVLNKPAPDYMQPLKQVGIHFDAGTINIGKHRTIAELEKDFNYLFCSSAKVFRKSGNVWIETSLTNDWTLEHQNSEGELISAHF